MKTIKIFIAIMARTTTVAKAQFIKADLQVGGLTCSLCSKATEKSLRSLPFISDIKPDLNRNLFNITFKANTPVSLQQLNKKVQSAGFSINQLTATLDFDRLKVNNNTFNYAGDTYHLVNAGGKELDGRLPVRVVSQGFAPASVVKKYSNSVSAANTQAYKLVL